MAITEEEFQQYQRNVAKGQGGTPPPAQKPPLKYRNHPVRVDGDYFHSTGEQQRWATLQARQDRGEIAQLSRQVKIEVVPGVFWEAEGEFLSPIFWVVDFLYFHCEWGRWVAEDWKSIITRNLPEYKLKRQCFLQRYGNKLLYVETGTHV